MLILGFILGSAISAPLGYCVAYRVLSGRYSMALDIALLRRQRPGGRMSRVRVSNRRSNR